MNKHGADNTLKLLTKIIQPKKQTENPEIDEEHKIKLNQTKRKWINNIFGSWLKLYTYKNLRRRIHSK